MKRKDKLKRREKYSHAFFLFGQCYSISKVACELDISYKEAKQLHNFYLDSQQVDEETQREMTAFYEKELEQSQRKSNCGETIERIKKNVKEERQKDLDRERISKDSILLLDFLYEKKAEVVEIFFYNCAGVCFAHWAKKEWEHSPFWMNFEARFYSKYYSCFCYN